jgi:diacylglycerol kinase (ATP)
MKKVLFIVNPISGTSKKENMEFVISRWVDKSLYETAIHYTQYAGHATEIVYQRRHEFDIVAAVGGDGTVNEISKALVGSPTALYIVPTGSGNGLARHLKIPVGLRPSLRRLNKAEHTLIDTCTVNSTPFFCTAGIGFDAEVAHRFSLAQSRGLWTYMKTSLFTYFDYQPQVYELEIDGQKQTRLLHLLTCANAGQYGNNAYISPSADIADGHLDLCLVKPMKSAWEAIRFSFNLFSYSLHLNKSVEIIKAKNVKISRKKSDWLHADGEPMAMPADLDFKITPQSLHVWH